MGMEQESLAALAVVPGKPSAASEWTQCLAPGPVMAITTMPQILTLVVPTAAAAPMDFQSPGTGPWITLVIR